ncbi:hypothetical protein RA280_42015 [Cupriavidus sp. CV2]|uniref:hypothetical protein n=1 Tax=Cupriavidus ulmosensis TaxID=3065913 RepID=UPI00296B3F70|nr:hypothetical protein [Cupriavidus sp. CV2]MDW3688198.1 hypothetical protein [Cupriavidus sp. CV2]
MKLQWQGKPLPVTLHYSGTRQKHRDPGRLLLSKRPVIHKAESIVRLCARAVPNALQSLAVPEETP